MKAKRFLALLTSAIMAATMLSACANTPKDDALEQPTAEITSAPEEDAGGSDSETTAKEASDEAEAEATTPETEASTAPETTPAATTEATTATTQATTTAAPATTQATTTAAPATTAATTTVKVESASGKMYAKSSVNVRSGPGTDYERVGHLDFGEEVELTGVCENGWYRIKFQGGEYFVSGKYLVKDKPAVTTAATTAKTEAKTTEKTEATKEDDKMTQIKNEIWLATWGTAMLTPGDEQIPKNPTLANNTLRQQIRVSVGGNKLRLVISNEYGQSDLEINSLILARIDNPKSHEVDLDSQVALTYNSKKSFKVPAGKRITTDEIDFEFAPLEDLAITMKLGAVPSTLTCHTASRCSTWIVKGDHAKDNSFTNIEEMTSWYFITELDTMASKESGAIVCLGDSLTDGASVTTNAFARYTDELARQLQNDDKLNNLSVVNMGIGATALYTYGGDIAGTNRANRDVLKVPGVKYCVLFMGVNDIGGAQSDISDNIIREYKSIIDRCHKQGIKVIGVTITPFKGNGYYSDLHEKIRKKVNKFVLSKDSGFDACIDMCELVASKADPDKMSVTYVSPWNDYLHFNHQGYRLIGKTVYQHLKELIG